VPTAIKDQSELVKNDGSFTGNPHFEIRVFLVDGAVIRQPVAVMGRENEYQGEISMRGKTVDMKALICRFMIIPAFVVAGQAMAQSGALEEVVVTAQKREESLQDTPLSITALSAAAIKDFNVSDITQLDTLMPSVRFMGGEGGNGAINVVIRGVGTYNNQPNVDMAVAWNIDGTYISHHMAIPPILFDLERIELVRGPLGTLYGKNSNGGSINVVTARPVLGEWQASGEVGYGNYDQVASEWMANIPLGEHAAIRVALTNNYRDGYYEDGGYGIDNYAGRVRVLFEPSDRFDLLATLEWSDADGSGPSLGYCPPTARSTFPACVGVQWKPYQGLGLPGNFAQFGTDGPIGESPGFSKRENWSAYLEWNYRWDIATLTSISNWHQYDREEFHVWDFFTYRPVHDNTYVTQELRLASNPGSRFDWVVGVFLADEESTGREHFGPISADLTRQVVNNYYGVDNGEVVTRAFFGDVTIPINDRFRIRGGLRWTYERKDLPGSAATGLVPGGTPVFVTTGSTLKEKGKITWSAGAEYDLTDQNMVYFKINTGFKSGTVNQIPDTVTAVAPTTDPEEVIAYQIGSKNFFLDGRLRINAEFFHYEYEGYQVVVAVADPSGFFPGVFFPSVNAQKARHWGGEIESTFVPWDNGQLDLALTWLDAKHTKFVTPAFDWSGNDMLSSPDYTIIAGYQHQWALPNGGTLSGRVSTQYVDAYFTHDNNVPGSFQDSYTRTNLSLNYTHPGSNWSIRGWVRNLENDDVVNVSQFSCCRGGWAVFMKPPRMYGVSVKYEM
jgi:iron complex outermembrane receptor protein